MTHKALIRQLQISCLGLDPIDPLRLLVDDVIEALAQPEQKPTYGSEEVRKLREVIASQAKIIEDHIPDARKMVTEQEPVALQDDEIYDAAFSAYCRGENSRELFRIMWSNRLTCSIGWDRDELKSFARNIAALYTTPPQRTWVGLTEEDIDDAEIHLTSCRNNHESWIEGIQEFAQAIEAKLKEKNT